MHQRVEQLDEHDLIARCRAGDQEAFRTLVERYQDLVYGLISRTLFDREQADDLAQEAFLRVHRGLPYFRRDARLSTWIYRIVINLCAQQRGRTSPLELSLDETTDAGRPRVDPGGPDRAFTDFELRERLDKALAQLPSQHRVLIAAHYMDGVRYQELADAFGLPLGTVKTQLHRAKRRLRELLADMLRHGM